VDLKNGIDIDIYNGVLYGHMKNETMQFEGKSIELENIRSSEVRQVQKDKDHIFSHMCKLDPDDNIYTKTNMSTHTFI
jgi:hypothetical protein